MNLEESVFEDDNLKSIIDAKVTVTMKFSAADHLRCHKTEDVTVV